MPNCHKPGTEWVSVKERLPEPPQEDDQAVVLGEEVWHRGSKSPQRACWVVALWDVNGYSLTKQLLYHSGGDYYFNSDFGHRADIEPVAWMELPEVPDWAEVERK